MKRFRLAKVFGTLLVIAGSAQSQYTVSIVAGGEPGLLKPATAARAQVLTGPSGVAWDSLGRFYISTNASQVIRVNQNGLIDVVIGNGITGFAGDGGPAVAPNVELSSPQGLAVDRANNLYIVDSGNSRVRKVDGGTGIISTVAANGAAGTQCDLGYPIGIAADSTGNLFIGTYNCVLRVAAGNGVAEQFAGNGTQGFSGDGGPAANAQLGGPSGLAVDRLGNVYIADPLNNRVRMVSAASGIITTIAGNGASTDSGDGGPATSAGVFGPSWVAVDLAGNILISGFTSLRKVDAATGIITTYAGPDAGILPFAGEGEPAVDAIVPSGGAVGVDSTGNLLLCDSVDGLVLRIDAATTIVTRVAGSSSVPSTQALLGALGGLAVDSSGNIFIGDQVDISLAPTVKEVFAVSGTIATIATVPGGAFSNDAGVPLPQVAVDSSGNVYFTNQTINLSNSFQISKVSALTAEVTPFAGQSFGGCSGQGPDNIPAAQAALCGLGGIIADSTSLYVNVSGSIRPIDLTTGIITTAAINVPYGSFDRDAAGNFYFTSGDSIVKYTAVTGAITTLAGSLKNASGATGTMTGAELGDGGPAKRAILNSPRDVKVDPSGNIYIADTGDHRVRLISAATGIITTFAGSNAAGCTSAGGLARDALFASPSRLALDASGSVYVADVTCQQVVKLSLGPTPPTLIAPMDGTDLSLFSGDTLTWNPSIGATSYDVLFGIGTVAPPPFVANASGTSYTFPTPSPGSVYSWQIVAKNDKGSARSPVYSFTAGSGCVSSLVLGAPDSITVNAANSCTWAAGSNASWITISAPASGSGNGTVNFSLAPNLGSVRTGTIAAGGQTLRISQLAARLEPVRHF